MPVELNSSNLQVRDVVELYLGKFRVWHYPRGHAAAAWSRGEFICIRVTDGRTDTWSLTLLCACCTYIGDPAGTCIVLAAGVAKLSLYYSYSSLPPPTNQCLHPPH